MKKALWMLLIALTLGSTFAFAEEAQAPAAGSEKEKKMAEMKKYTEPNENHKALEPLIGNFKAKCSFWMDPAGQPEVSEGASNNHWIMGGRFVQQDYKGTAMGQPFEGMGITGYDLIKAEYTSIWLDSMVTGIMVSSGQMDASTKTLNQSGTMSCPMTMEKAREMKSALTITDADHHTYVGLMKDKDGKEFKGMEITYERVKA